MSDVMRYSAQLVENDAGVPYMADMVEAPRSGSYVKFSDYDVLRQENLDLHAEISMIKSPEVCAAAHENVDDCGYCQRDAAMESLVNQQTATQLALSTIADLERSAAKLYEARDLSAIATATLREESLAHQARAKKAEDLIELLRSIKSMHVMGWAHAAMKLLDKGEWYDTPG